MTKLSEQTNLQANLPEGEKKKENLPVSSEKLWPRTWKDHSFRSQFFTKRTS